MNEKDFFEHYPKRKEDSNKYDNGVVAFVSGSYGMAGAAYYNLIGARSIGASYIHSFLPGSIYPIVAANEMSAVYHPYDADQKDIFDEIFFRKIKAIGFGSGMDRSKYAKEYFEYLLTNINVPFVVDAYGLKNLAQNEELYKLNENLILTPHMGEFSLLCRMDIEKIEIDKVKIASDFAKKKRITLVLKGPETIIAYKDGRIKKNDSGNSCLARAGSGDILTGMIAGACALYEDTDIAVEDAVWLHGHIADLAMKKHAKENFDLQLYPKIADYFFFSKR